MHSICYKQEYTLRMENLRFADLKGKISLQFEKSKLMMPIRFIYFEHFLKKFQLLWCLSNINHWKSVWCPLQSHCFLCWICFVQTGWIMVSYMVSRQPVKKDLLFVNMSSTLNTARDLRYHAKLHNKSTFHNTLRYLTEGFNIMETSCDIGIHDQRRAKC